MPTGVSRCEIATQTCGLFYPSEREIQKKKREEEEKVAVEKQMRDRNPLLTAVSPGRGMSIHCEAAAILLRSLLMLSSRLFIVVSFPSSLTSSQPSSLTSSQPSSLTIPLSHDMAKPSKFDLVDYLKNITLFVHTRSVTGPTVFCFLFSFCPIWAPRL